MSVMSSETPLNDQCHDTGNRVSLMTSHGNMTAKPRWTVNTWDGVVILVRTEMKLSRHLHINFSFLVKIQQITNPNDFLKMFYAIKSIELNPVPLLSEESKKNKIFSQIEIQN